MTPTPTETSTTTESWLILPRQSPWFGPLSIAAGLGGLALAIWALVDATGGLAAAILPATLGIVSLSGGLLLSSRRGGVAIVPHGHEVALSLGGDRPESAFVVPASLITAIRVRRVSEGDDDSPYVTFGVEAQLRSGASVLIAEAREEDELAPLVQELTARFPARPEAQPARSTDATVNGDQTLVVHVGAQGHLPRTLGLVAFAMLGAGAVALADMSNAAYATFIGVPLAGLGLVLGLLPALKAITTERLVLSADGRYHHEYRALGFGWGAREGRADPRGGVRLRQRGLMGCTVELIGERRVQLIAGGVQVTSGGLNQKTGHAELATLATTIAAWHRATSSPSRGDE
jgi:hypothetical protein